MNRHTNSLFTAVLGIAAGACGGATLGALVVANDEQDAVSDSSVDGLRAQGQAGLDKALAIYDAAAGNRSETDATSANLDALEQLVDRVAAQRYATVSRLFWHTDLERAKAESMATGKPILSLRMLGRLDEDLSCANSRLFRVVLYGNQDVSAFLRATFILHWSSERLVPRVTIDYGDGRVIETTVAGNSVHYVLDGQGRPVDAVPGLYGPQAFVAALSRAAPIAAELSRLFGVERRKALASYHRAELQRASRGGQIKVPGTNVVLTSAVGSAVGSAPTIAEAELTTMSKAIVEMPLVRTFTIGKQLLDLATRESMRESLAASVSTKTKLDRSTRELIARLRPTDWGPSPKPIDSQALAVLVTRLSQQIDADTALGELGLHIEIRKLFVELGEPTFAVLNQRIYSDLFLTPASDPWLGVATPGVFTGLPSDGHREPPAVQGQAVQRQARR